MQKTNTILFYIKDKCDQMRLHSYRFSSFYKIIFVSTCPLTWYELERILKTRFLQNLICKVAPLASREKLWLKPLIATIIPAVENTRDSVPRHAFVCV